jgi:urease accessory protein UreF
MLDQSYSLAPSTSEILGDLSGLAEQLGATEGLCRLPLAGGGWESGAITSVAALRKFLEEYAGRILAVHELPAIARAYGHVAKSEARELIAFDQALTAEPALKEFARASRSVGQIQLERLRPLRGERVVQRYLKAVEEGSANAWHTVVFGMVLALYSMPLRQGLIHFAHQTLGGFVQAASTRVTLSSSDRHDILAAHGEGILRAVESVLASEFTRIG